MKSMHSLGRIDNQGSSGRLTCERVGGRWGAAWVVVLRDARCG